MEEGKVTDEERKHRDEELTKANNIRMKLDGTQIPEPAVPELQYTSPQYSAEYIDSTETLEEDDEDTVLEKHQL